VAIGNTTVMFGAMDVQADITLSIINDNILELEEHFVLDLIISNASKMIGVGEGTVISATGKILNDDSKCLLFLSKRLLHMLIHNSNYCI